MSDYSKMTRNELVDALRNRRADVRASKDSAKVAILDADPQERLDQLAMALEAQQEVVAIRERQLQIDREARDALSIESQRATLEAEEKRGATS